jgi:hypothetical protein
MLMGPSLTIDQPETFFAVRGEELLNETGDYFVTTTQEEGKPKQQHGELPQKVDNRYASCCSDGPTVVIA